MLLMVVCLILFVLIRVVGLLRIWLSRWCLICVGSCGWWVIWGCCVGVMIGLSRCWVFFVVVFMILFGMVWIICGWFVRVCWSVMCGMV